MQPSALVDSLVAPFARALLTKELPGLPSDRLDQVVAFVLRRVDGLPSPARIGVLAVAAGTRGLMAVPGGATRVPAFLGEHPLPLIGEYARLVRSLGFAFLFEEWPDSAADGTPAAPDSEPVADAPVLS